MKAHIIENGRVVNTIVVESLDVIDGLVDASNGGLIGDFYQDGQFITSISVIDPLQYKQNRATEYPPITDYIDGVVKGDQSQIQAYIDACLAVKAKYPKP
jgi:hypothetical protein